jgi:hypothetical protein
MPEERMVKKYTSGKEVLRRPLGRPNNRWEDDIRSEIKTTENKELD